MTKSTVEQIRARFDQDVERFSSLETAQAAIPDAALMLELITTAAATVTPHAVALLDVGCGAGNYSLKLLQRLPNLHVSLVDLSRPMLDRAGERVRAGGAGTVSIHQADVRDISLVDGIYDIVFAAAVLHHLRSDAEWQAVFEKLFRCLRPGGSLWISDMVQHTTPGVQTLMWARYGEHLSGLKDVAYRDSVFAYIEREDTPRPLLEQMDRLRAVGFDAVELLHKNGPFAAFGGIKRASKSD